MAGFNWGFVLNAVLVACIMGTLAFLGWLWKKSVYGEFERQGKEISDGKSELSKSLMEAKVTLTEYVKAEMSKLEKSFSNLYNRINTLDIHKRETAECSAMRDSCTKVLIERFISFEKRLDDTQEHFDKQVSQVLAAVGKVADRVDNMIMKDSRKWP
jgi:hypothetical protein